MSYLRGLHIVLCNTYCVVFLFCFSSSCVPYVASFSGLSISVFSNVYLFNSHWLLYRENALHIARR